MVTLGAAAVRINGITIYLVYNLLKDTFWVGSSKDINRFNPSSLVGLCVNGETRIN